MLESGPARVLVACPTGALVSTYRERVVEDERIVVQTIHSSFRVARAADMATYNPPSSLNQFELIVIEEASQIDNLLSRSCVWLSWRCPSDHSCV